MSLTVLSILRATPLVTSTALLVSNLDQINCLNSWLDQSSQTRTQASRVLPHWYQSWYLRQVPMLGVLIVLAIASGAANLSLRDDSEQAERCLRWYGASMLFTLIHGAFSYSAYKQIKVIRNVEGAGERNMKGLEDWLAVNRCRLVWSEIPAFCTAVVAVTLWARV